MDPRRLMINQISQPFIHRLDASRPIILTSVMLVSDCHLINLKTSSNTKPQKVISGGIFEGEWERLVGAIGMIAHVTDYKAQLYMDKLSFSTAPQQGDGAQSYFNMFRLLISDFLFFFLKKKSDSGFSSLSH